MCQVLLLLCAESLKVFTVSSILTVNVHKNIYKGRTRDYVTITTQTGLKIIQNGGGGEIVA
jgi:hypothetical protein